ncbi:hypothetical protein OAJ27_01625 [bacterium]|nr:hypothetical protein [bacterium]
MKQQLPVSVALLKALSTNLDLVHVFLKKQSAEYKFLCTLTKDVERISEDSRFLESPACIHYFQVAMLMGMSMFGGIKVTCLSAFSDHDQKVSLTWDSGSTDSFTWGVYDDACKRFVRYYQDRLSSVPQHRDYIPGGILQGVFGFLKSYMLILKASDNQVKALVTTKQGVVNILEDDLHRDMMFILMSSLPAANMNQLFLHVHQFFPKDMEVTTPDGRQMNIHSFFDQTSTDIYYLIEKTHVYLDLYFNTKMPVIKEITQTKTKAYLKKLLENDRVFQETLGNLKRIQTSQLQPRMTLYRLFLEHLEGVL